MSEKTLNHKVYHATLQVNQRGHRVLGTNMMKYDDGTEYGNYAYVSNIAAEFFIQEYPDIPMKSAMCHDAFSCASCNEYPSFEEDSYGRMQMKTDCKYSDGLTTVVEINVPSGRLICDDDLRDAWDVPEAVEQKLVSYNSALGQHQAIQAYADADYAYGPVGNTCPALVETAPGTYVIATSAWDNETDEAEVFSFGGKVVNSFCTDLWAYSMMDYALFLERSGKPIEENDQNGTRWVMNVPAGKYRLTHHTGEREFDRNAPGEIIYAHFERIGNCNV